ncbi:MAG: DUF2087 domain-containing protein [Anaerolineales bacterium]|nr:DUF2087 domain-containing protein [Anaerolineales bacterium]
MEPHQKDALMQFFRAASQADRLKILGLTANQAYTPPELAEVLGIRETAVVHHLRRLMEAELVSETLDTAGNRYRLRGDYLALLNQTVLEGEELEPLPTRVMRKYVKDGRRLKAIPRDAAERQVILEWLADKFEVNKQYTEASVIGVLQRHFHKQETLRRYLLDAQLLMHTGGIYWRPAPQN